MDMVTCSCAKCGTSVGDFENLWNRIGKRHFSPVSLKDWSTGLQHSGDVRIAPTETMIEDR
jgi:Fe-S cluster biosynthesis and repair protein YggX